MHIKDEALVAYKDGELYYGHEELGSEAWYREVMADSGIDLLISRYFYWVRKFPSATVFVTGRGNWRIFLHTPDAMQSAWMFELENHDTNTYVKGYGITYVEVANQILQITEGDNNAA